jgi:hypothetical protein
MKSWNKMIAHKEDLIAEYNQLETYQRKIFDESNQKLLDKGKEGIHGLPLNPIKSKLTKHNELKPAYNKRAPNEPRDFHRKWIKADQRQRKIVSDVRKINEKIRKEVWG